MDDAQDVWPFLPFSDLEEVAVLVAVVAVLGLRVWPVTRRWAPRGNAPRPSRSRERTVAAPGRPDDLADVG